MGIDFDTSNIRKKRKKTKRGVGVSGGSYGRVINSSTGPKIVYSSPVFIAGGVRSNPLDKNRFKSADVGSGFYVGPTTVVRRSYGGPRSRSMDPRRTFSDEERYFYGRQKAAERELAARGRSATPSSVRTFTPSVHSVRSASSNRSSMSSGITLTPDQFSPAMRERLFPFGKVARFERRSFEVGKRSVALDVDVNLERRIVTIEQNISNLKHTSNFYGIVAVAVCTKYRRSIRQAVSSAAGPSKSSDGSEVVGEVVPSPDKVADFRLLQYQLSAVLEDPLPTFEEYYKGTVELGMRRNGYPDFSLDEAVFYVFPQSVSYDQLISRVPVEPVDMPVYGVPEVDAVFSELSSNAPVNIQPVAKESVVTHPVSMEEVVEPGDYVKIGEYDEDDVEIVDVVSTPDVVAQNIKKVINRLGPHFESKPRSATVVREGRSAKRTKKLAKGQTTLDPEKFRTTPKTVWSKNGKFFVPRAVEDPQSMLDQALPIDKKERELALARIADVGKDLGHQLDLKEMYKVVKDFREENGIDAKERDRQVRHIRDILDANRENLVLDYLQGVKRNELRTTDAGELANNGLAYIKALEADVNYSKNVLHRVYELEKDLYGKRIRTNLKNVKGGATYDWGDVERKRAESVASEKFEFKEVKDGAVDPKRKAAVLKALREYSDDGKKTDKPSKRVNNGKSSRTMSVDRTSSVLELEAKLHDPRRKDVDIIDLTKDDLN